jgi:Stage II sporulation protein E (SpoIIE)
MNSHKISIVGINNDFQIFHGAVSRIGESHINFPIGYQDAQFCVNQNGIFIGVICDGCSFATDGYTQNQVGAILGSEMIARNIFDLIKYQGNENVNFNEILAKANDLSKRFFEKILSSLGLRRLGIDKKKFIEEKLLFTVIGLMIVNNSYCIFGCGDGVFGINEDNCDVEKGKLSSPKYLQPLLNSRVVEQFHIYRKGEIKDGDTLWIASDGLLNLLENEDGISNFSDFLGDERTCKTVEDNNQTVQPFRQLTQKYKNRLSDDIALVVTKIKKNPEKMATDNEVQPE